MANMRKSSAARVRGESPESKKQRGSHMSQSMQVMRENIGRKARTHKRYCAMPPGVNDKQQEVDKCLSLGNMDQQCRYCGSKMWLAERLTQSSNKKPNFDLCCKNGKVRLPPWKPPPQVLRDLLDNNDNDSKFYKQKIRSFNSNLAYASLQVDTADLGRGVQVFKMHGESYHRIGNICEVINQNILI